MPYPRKTYSRSKRKSYSRGGSKMMSYGSKALRYGQMAYTGYRLATKVASMINAEEKIYDRDESEQPDVNGLTLVLNNPAQGDTDATRDGDSLKMKSVTIRGQLFRGTSTNDTTQVRIIFFMWKQPLTTPAPSDVLEAIADLVNAPKNHDKRFLSKILYDKIFELNPGVGEGKHFKFHFRFKGKYAKYSHVQYNGGTQNLNNNGLYCLMCSNDATAQAPTVDFYSRVIFYDN